MTWLFWLGLALTCSVPLTITLALTILYVHLRINYVQYVVRIFQEKPLFIIPRGQPAADAEDVRFPGPGGLSLGGCYLKARGPRRGVILFGLEFGSNRWSCRHYCEHLLDAGFDVFAWEPRNQGDSDAQPDYEPLQWVTDYEVADARAALDYLRSRSDADPRGVGFFGISKGAGAGLFVAAEEPYIRCCVTDGVFGTYTTLVPYMRKWYQIYNNNYVRQRIVPSWFYGLIGKVGLQQLEDLRRCRFPRLERAMRRLRQPLLLIHGAEDAYIKPAMAEELYRLAAGPKEYWLVEGAKHNQALSLVGEEYRRRVLEFFERYMPPREPPATAPLAAARDTAGS